MESKKEESGTDSSDEGGVTTKAPPLRRDTRVTSSMDVKANKNEGDKITYDINEGVQPHEIISQNIQKFFKYNEKNLVRPQVTVDQAEQTKARTWVFFLIVVQLIVCVGYGFFLFYVPSDIVWWIHAMSLIFYFGIKLLFIIVYNLKRLFTCGVCTNKFDPETMSMFEEIFICIPVFNESKWALERLVASIYSANYTKHKMYMVFVVDGNKNNTFQSLMEVLEGTPFTERIQNGKPFTKHGVCHGVCYSVYLKDNNRGKRDSQWVFIELVRNIFPEHKPPYLAFLDSDCNVHPDAFRYMVDKFKKDKDVAGVCGSIRLSNLLLKGQAVDNIIFRLSTLIIVGMQYYEYCWNAVFSKQFEAATNSLTGMHGQFAMYRTDVLTNIDAKVNPVPAPELDPILKDLALPSDRSSVSFFYVSKVKKTAPLITQDFFSKPTIGLIDRNLYDLGSERTLARRLLELKYKTVYEPRAICWTEVPDSVSKFLHRRRRWLNATFMNQVMMLLRGSLWCQPRMWPILWVTLLEIIGAYILPTIGVVVLYEVWGYMLKEVEVSVSLVLFVWIIVQVLVIASTKMDSSDMFYVISCFVSGLMMATAAYFFVRFTVIEVVKFTINNNIGNWQRTVVYLIFPAMHLFISITHPLAFFAAIANYLFFPTITITAPLYAFFHLDDFSWASR